MGQYTESVTECCTKRDGKENLDEHGNVIPNHPSTQEWKVPTKEEAAEKANNLKQKAYEKS